MPDFGNGPFTALRLRSGRLDLSDFAGGSSSDALIIVGVVIALVILYYLWEMVRISATDF